MVVAVIADVLVIGPVTVAVHVHVNDTVGVIAPRSEPARSLTL